MTDNVYDIIEQFPTVKKIILTIGKRKIYYLEREREREKQLYIAVFISNVLIRINDNLLARTILIIITIHHCLRFFVCFIFNYIFLIFTIIISIWC